MPRVHTAKAARDYPQHGIKKGDTYYHWSFYRGRKQMSATPPKGSQLTQREEYVALLQAQELLEEVSWESSERDALVDAVETAISLVNDATNAAQEKYDNLPENFQQGEQGQQLDEFASSCDQLESELHEIRDQLGEDGMEFDEITNPLDLSWPETT